MARRDRWSRRLGRVLAVPLVKLIFKVLWATCRVERVLGEEHVEQVLADGKPVIPCYWHQHHLFGSYYMFRLARRGLKVGFLVSPSRDGETAARVVRDWGAVVIRGSATRTGAQALRELYQVVTRDGVSPVHTADGPTGPLHEFKAGAVMLAQITQAPLLPLAWAASRCWRLKSWDRFVIPKPFARIVIAVGAPRAVPKNLGVEALAPVQREMEQTLAGLIDAAESALVDSAPGERR